MGRAYPGRLGFVAIGAAVLMASMSGSALADTAALATILLPMMRERGYPMETSAGLIARAASSPHHPAVHALRDLRRHDQHLDFRAVRFGHRARLGDGVGLILAWLWVLRDLDLPGGPRRAAPLSAARLRSTAARAGPC